ncbi:hypothetical protein RHGRI_011160 [Rhododendron griersonianum]|uniref:Uncharacterized protein n=1 Tax=Rhododendron griersonianum TaxID=479676 RepID=A0AAV6KL06_9ERIC|nr:hypothetical protein RHGRI_011160 [Rhododendron griersonianum]
MNLQTDRGVYKPGDPVVVTIEIRNNSPSSSGLGMNNGATTSSSSSGNSDAAESSLLIERLAFEIKGIEKLYTQWFTTQKSSPDSKQRRGRFSLSKVSVALRFDSNSIRYLIGLVSFAWSADTSCEYVFMDCSATSLVSNQIINCGATKTYLVRTVLPSIIPPSYRGATLRYLYYIRCMLSGQSLVLENGHSHEESSTDFAELEAQVPLQILVTQSTNGLPIEEGRSDGIVPASTVLLDIYWKEMDGDSDWSSVGRFSNPDASYLKERTSIHSYMPLPQLSVAEVLYDSGGDILTPQKSSATGSPSLQLKHSKSLPTDDDLRVTSVPGAVEPLACNLLFYLFYIGGTLTLFNEEGSKGDALRFEHPLLIEGRDKCEWVLPITVHAPPVGTPGIHTCSEKPVTLEPLWLRT